MKSVGSVIQVRSAAFALCLACMLIGCGKREADNTESTPPTPHPAPYSGIQFVDVTAQSGLDMILTSGAKESQQILEVKGGGIALIDFDNDGDLDVFVPNGATIGNPEHGPGARLWENRGNMKFQDATERAGITHHRWSVGVAVGDYDGDGFDDIYITCFGPNVLLRNTGDGRFEDVTRRAGVGDPRWGTAAAFGDIDGDGDLDLYVANYLQFNALNPPPPSTFKGQKVLAGPSGLPPQADVLYVNRGDGSFVDATAEAGCATVPPSYGLGVVILDFDLDGDQDIYVGNDSMPNFMFTNHGDGTFRDSGMRSGAASNGDGANQATMGIAIADVDGNGLPDIFSSNFASDTNTLHMNEGAFFNDQTRQRGLGMSSYTYLGWAAAFFDFDHDGDEDLLIFNGHVYPNATRATMDSDRAQTPLLYERIGSRFELVDDSEAGAWLYASHVDRGAAFGDLDGDGDIDAVVAELNGPIRVLRNERDAGHRLIVELVGPHDFGSLIEVTANDETQRRWIYSGGSFASASAQYAHFGFADAVESVTVKITRVDGSVQLLEDVALNQHLRVEPSDAE